MKRFANLKFIALFALLVSVPFAAGVYTEHAAAHEGEDHSAEVTQAQAEENQDQVAEAEATYDYEAQAGDSYAVIARKAVQTYGINNNVNLSQAQIIFAETNLTLEAGSPLLGVNEKVSVKESTVKSWVEKAQKLSDEDKQAWEIYTAGVDFNTDNVGEKR